MQKFRKEVSASKLDGGLEKAIYNYMTLQNNFNEDDGIFADINGYIIEE